MKVGDKIRFIKSRSKMNEGNVTIGKVYTIIEIDSDGDLWVKDDGYENFFLTPSEVELVNENTDSIVESVLSQFKQRSEAGIRKYNTTLERNDLNTLQWLTHLQEELMDATLYIERLKQEYDRD